MCEVNHVEEATQCEEWMCTGRRRDTDAPEEARSL